MVRPQQIAIRNTAPSVWPLALVLAALMLAALGGCRGAQTAGQYSEPASGPKMYPAVADWPRAFTDDLGNTITFNRPPQHLISLSPNLTEIVFLVGAGEQLAGRTDFCDYPPEALDKPTIGGIINPSLEKLVSLEPDSVLAARGVQAAFLDRLREMEIPVLGYDPQTLDDVIALVKRIGQLTGHDPEGAEAADRLAERKAQVEADSRQWAGTRLSVLFILSREPLFVAGTSSFVDDILRTCGARNAITGLSGVDQHRPWPQISREAIVAADPQLLIFAQTHGAGAADVPTDILAQLANTSAWREVAAVKNSHVYTINDDLVTIPGPRLIDGLEGICRFVSQAIPSYQE